VTSISSGPLQQPLFSLPRLRNPTRRRFSLFCLCSIHPLLLIPLFSRNGIVPNWLLLKAHPQPLLVGLHSLYPNKVPPRLLQLPFFSEGPLQVGSRLFCVFPCFNPCSPPSAFDSRSICYHNNFVKEVLVPYVQTTHPSAIIPSIRVGVLPSPFTAAIVSFFRRLRSFPWSTFCFVKELRW